MSAKGAIEHDLQYDESTTCHHGSLSWTRGSTPHYQPIFIVVTDFTPLIAFCEPFYTATSSTANDPDLNHTRRRLSVLSDNKLVDGVDSLNLDKTEEAPPSGNVSNRINLGWAGGMLSSVVLITYHLSLITYHLSPHHVMLMFFPVHYSLTSADGTTVGRVYCQFVRRIFKERLCPVQS